MEFIVTVPASVVRAAVPMRTVPLLSEKPPALKVSDPVSTVPDMPTSSPVPLNSVELSEALLKLAENLPAVPFCHVPPAPVPSQP
jgi:hypothetical protein